MNAAPVTGYVADIDTSYRYPGAGDPLPPGGAKTLLLTDTGICVSGCWRDDGHFLAWAPMPRRNHDKEKQCSAR